METLKNIVDTLKVWATNNPKKAIFLYGFVFGLIVGFIIF